MYIQQKIEQPWGFLLWQEGGKKAIFLWDIVSPKRKEKGFKDTSGMNSWGRMEAAAECPWIQHTPGILPSRQPGQGSSRDGNSPCANRETALLVWELVLWNLPWPHLLLQLSAGTAHTSRLFPETDSFPPVKMAKQERLSWELNFLKSWDVKKGKHPNSTGQELLCSPPDFGLWPFFFAAFKRGSCSYQTPYQGRTLKVRNDSEAHQWQNTSSSQTGLN